MGKMPSATISSGEQAVWRAYVRNTHRRGLVEWGLNRKDFSHLIQQNCEYCKGPPRNRVPFFLFTFLYQGIDRKNNAEGYTKGNTVPCCHRCNSIKGRYLSHEEMIFVAQALLALTRVEARLRAALAPLVHGGSIGCIRRVARQGSSARGSRGGAGRTSRKPL